jgi:hypothetical protein
MKTLVSKNDLNRMALCLCLLSVLAIAQGANPIAINSTAGHRQAKKNSGVMRQAAFHYGLMGLTCASEVTMAPENFDIDTSKAASGSAIQFGEFLGRRAIYLPSGLLKVKGPKFRDGTLDVDVASKPGGLFVGIAFRIESEANMEIVYLRPLASDTIEAMQYTPRLNGDAIWQLLNSSHEKASAHIPENQWFHMRLVVRGRTCTVYLNESTVPTLTVTKLRRETVKEELACGNWVAEDISVT